MEGALLITVRFHEGRYHGSGDWPPSPARLFQAMVAGAARGRLIPPEDREALLWLEGLGAPLIAAPAARKGRTFNNYVPNNDLDAVGGDPNRVDEIRTEKLIRCNLFDPDVPLIYSWLLNPANARSVKADRIRLMAERIYQVGRGIDMACAWAETRTVSDLHRELDHYPGHVHSPAYKGRGLALECPTQGSLRSLEERFAATLDKLSRGNAANSSSLHFAQAPKPHFDSVVYDSPTERLLFEVRTSLGNAPLVALPLTRAPEWVASIRDKAAERLRRSLPRRAAEIDRILIGRESDESHKAVRVRIVPLPSIGHPQADRAIRRVVIEVPPACPLPLRDIEWAFSDLALKEEISADGELLKDIRLIPGEAQAMLSYFGIGAGEQARVWRTVTPAALPERAARRRIDPKRIRYEMKGALERTREHYTAAHAAMQALRHAGIKKGVHAVRVQREPFDLKGERAEAFAWSDRFRKERLWHVEVAFTEAIAGPVVVGDGRYMGLGLMRPLAEPNGVFAFSILGGITEKADTTVLSCALRRAVMARVQEEVGQQKELPSFFTGHQSDGAPLRNGHHAHLAFAVDLPRQRLLVIAPHMLEGREASVIEREHLKILQRAIAGMNQLRAGSAGLLGLKRSVVEADEDPLFAPSQLWESVTQYQPTRYVKRVGKENAVAMDLRLELSRRGVANPEAIDVVELREGPRGGLGCRFRLRFRSPIAGLILIGRTRHVGGGLFAAIPS